MWSREIKKKGGRTPTREEAQKGGKVLLLHIDGVIQGRGGSVLVCERVSECVGRKKKD